MCARFTLRSDSYGLASLFDLDEAPNLGPRYNIAPTQQVAVVVEDATHKRHLEMRRWGLIPSWAKDKAIGQKMINARSETAAEKPSFRNAMKRRRCLIPADGFFEWREEGGRKQPYLIGMKDGRAFAFAGLWESWNDPEDGELLTCTILTTEANEFMSELHDRMPVILPKEDYTIWLDPANESPEKLTPLLRPCDPSLLRSFPVTPKMNSPRFQEPEAVLPIG